MPPKPTRTPEQIELPGRYYWLENGTTDGDIWSPSHAIIFQYVTREIATSFAAAMNAKAPFMKTEGVDFSQVDLKPGAYLPFTALQSPAGEWRPIATAPKDGAPVLLTKWRSRGAGGWQMTVAKWSTRTAKKDKGFVEEGWLHTLMANPTALLRWAPTHWMPLPPAPTGEG